MNLNKEQIKRNLTGRIGNDLARINETYPVAKICPTCGGERSYLYKGQIWECDCELQTLLQRHYFSANIGREYQQLCAEDFNGEDRDRVIPAVEHYLEQFDSNFHYGIGITFSGPRGTGKTFAMCIILKELVKMGRNVYLASFEELINLWASAYKDDEAKNRLESKLKRVEVLGLDEVKKDARNFKFLQHGYDSIIRHRTSNLLPTLVTTNMDPKEEEEWEGVYSLLAAKNERVILVGHDQRQKEVRENTFALRNAEERRPIC